jgi:hypothetical protein
LWLLGDFADGSASSTLAAAMTHTPSTRSPDRIRSDKLNRDDDQPTRSIGMAFNLAALPLQSLGLLAALVFLASLIGHSLSGSSKFLGAIFTVIIFAAAYVFWNYYDHGLVTAIRFKLT